MFSFQSGSSFLMLAKNLHDFQCAQNGHMLSNFFDLEMGAYQIFYALAFRGSLWTVHFYALPYWNSDNYSNKHL